MTTNDLTYWEILSDYSDHSPIQRVTSLTVEQRERLKERGYLVVRQSLDLVVWPWLLGEGE